MASERQTAENEAVSIELSMPDSERQEIAERLVSHIKNGSTDLAPGILQLAPDDFHSEDLAACERQAIFGRLPTIVAHASEVAKPHDFLAVALPNNDIVLVRQPDGSIRAFLNSCRHRGAKIVTEDSGSRRVLTCGYHGWSYGADGALRAVPDGDLFGQVDRSCLGLVEVPAYERHGLIWVQDSADAAHIDISAWLGHQTDEALAAYGLKDYACFRKGTFDEPINWKVLQDAFLDNYHIKVTHAKSVAPYFYSNVIAFTTYGRHSRTVAPKKSIDRISATNLAGEIGEHVAVGYFIMPNVMLIRQPDHFEMLTFLPDRNAAGQCRMEMRILVPRDALNDRLLPRWEKNWDILMAVLRDEDLVLNRHLQRSLQSRDGRPLVFGRNEIANQHFHSQLAHALQDPEYLHAPQP